MDKDLTFNISLKEFCIGLTRKEIKEYFGENFIENINDNTDYIYVNKMYYRCALDHVWADRQSDVCTDVWIDFEKTDRENKSGATFLGLPLNKKEERTIISVVVDMADEEPRIKINDESVLRRLIEIADEKRELENDLRYAAKRLHKLPKFLIGHAAYIVDNNEITIGVIESVSMDKSGMIYTYTTEGNPEKLTFTNTDIDNTVFETKEDAQLTLEMSLEEIERDER